MFSLLSATHICSVRAVCTENHDLMSRLHCCAMLKLGTPPQEEHRNESEDCPRFPGNCGRSSGQRLVWPSPSGAPFTRFHLSAPIGRTIALPCAIISIIPSLHLAQEKGPKVSIDTHSEACQGHLTGNIICTRRDSWNLLSENQSICSKSISLRAKTSLHKQMMILMTMIHICHMWWWNETDDDVDDAVDSMIQTYMMCCCIDRPTQLICIRIPMC